MGVCVCACVCVYVDLCSRVNFFVCAAPAVDGEEKGFHIKTIIPISSSAVESILG